MYYLEISHTQFSNGIPRHPLLTIEIPEEMDISPLLYLCCECDNDFDYWQINPKSDYKDVKVCFSSLMEHFGIVGSIWVEYYIKKNSYDI